MERQIILQGLTVEELKGLIREAVVFSIPNSRKADTPQAAQPEYLTKTQVAATLKVSPAKVQAMRRKGILVPVCVGRRPLYNKSEVIRLLESGKLSQV
jgi:hypothetical protein